MAHHNTQRRILADPEPKPSMDPNLKRHLKPKPKPKPKPTTTTTTTSQSHHQIRPNPDPTLPSKPSFMSHNFSKLNPYHKLNKSQNPTKSISHPTPCLLDTHLQAKAMSVSAFVDSSKFSLTRTTIAPKLEQESKARKELSKEKLKRPSKELDKKKVNDKKKETHQELDVKGLSEKLKDIELKDLQDWHESKRPSVSLAVRGGRRRSFCGSQFDLADILASNGVKVVSVDMPPFMQIHAVDCARKTHDSMEKFTSKTLALTLKKEFDGVYGPAWHCIVGTSFGSFVTHSVGGFMYFSMDQKLYILLFKTTVQRAD